ncbi:hypothetical protein Peur_031243 [Populus x canadensis]
MLKGPYVSSSQHIPSLVTYFHFGFTAGEFNGSSISVFSRNPISNTKRELAVVGRRGEFRLATGFAQLKTYFLNATNDKPGPRKTALDDPTCISFSDEIWVPEILPLLPALLTVPFYILHILRKNASLDLEFEIGNLESRRVLYGLTFLFVEKSRKTTVLETAIIVGD